MTLRLRSLFVLRALAGAVALASLPGVGLGQGAARPAGSYDCRGRLGGVEHTLRLRYEGTVVFAAAGAAPSSSLRYRAEFERADGLPLHRQVGRQLVVHNVEGLWAEARDGRHHTLLLETPFCTSTADDCVHLSLILEDFLPAFETDARHLNDVAVVLGHPVMGLRQPRVACVRLPAANR